MKKLKADIEHLITTAEAKGKSVLFKDVEGDEHKFEEVVKEGGELKLNYGGYEAQYDDECSHSYSKVKMIICGRDVDDESFQIFAR